MVVFIKKWLAIILIILATILFHSPFLTSLKLPIPADTIVGLYHPFRDLYASTNPNGLPYKNSLITDPVRQTFVWKELSLEMLSKGQLPLWNPYEMSGKPLLANIQSGAFYPLNIIFLIPPFYLGWSLFILLEMLLGGFLMYLYLKNLKLSVPAICIGTLAWIFSGFFIAWMEWGNVLHVAIWLPLLLLAKDKIVEKTTRSWVAILIVGETCALLAGHLQTWFYMTLFIDAYLLINLVSKKKILKKISVFAVSTVAVLAICIIQIIPSIQYILLSNRALDQLWTQKGWFIPYKQLVQFITPDYFGNPSTLNYFGVWNYAEFIGYIGIIPLIFALYAVIFRVNRKVYFFLAGVFLSILFATQNPVSEIPFRLSVPFLSTAQPTRLIFIADFSLAILAAFGFEYFIKKPKKIIVPILIITFIFASLWVVTVAHGNTLFGQINMTTAMSNMKLPSIIFAVGVAISIIYIYAKKQKIRRIAIWLLLIVVLFDLLRFGWKFDPFVDKKYLYPQTRTIEFIKKQPGIFRVASLDSRIMPPNFFTHYKVQTIEGYDPLYLSNYAQYVAMLERGKPDISGPYGFNRIITPHNFNSSLFDFLNTRYVLSLDTIVSPKLTKVFEEGKTKVYRNNNALERAFFIHYLISTKNVAKAVFDADLATEAVIEGTAGNKTFTVGRAQISKYEANNVEIQTENLGDGFLVLADTYYPTWRVYIDGQKANMNVVNLAFRGVYIPKGKHVVLFKNNLF